MTETHIHWAKTPDETVEVFGQSLRIRTGVDPNDPIGTLYIQAESFVGTPLILPNSISTAASWATIPGTSPVLQVRQDGHYPMEYIRVRYDATPLTITPGAGMTQGAKTAATFLIGDGKEVRMRGTLVATGVVATGSVIGNVNAAHFPLSSANTQVRYTGGGARFQILANGNVIINAALALNDNVWLDSITYDLIP